MAYKWFLPGFICILLSLSMPIQAKEDCVLVLGQYQDRFETIMVNIYDMDTYSARVISIPPGAVFQDGSPILKKPLHLALKEDGVEKVKSALAEYLNLKISNYMIVDYAGAKGVVDAMGGVDFELPEPIEIPEIDDEPYLYLQAGKHTFGGETARRFLRYRPENLNGSGELKVILLQQRFLDTMIRQLTQNKWNIISVALKLPKMLKTNMGVMKILDLGFAAIGMKPENLLVEFKVIPGQFIQVNGEYQYQIKEQKNYRELSTDLDQ
ncbi:MAG: LCP family protein [Halanaerobiales bacterium]|nr:LCP family protein [Halanaerobiales bacterium]